MSRITESMHPLTCKSDPSGQFNLSGLEEGNYDLKVEVKDYSDYLQKELKF